MCMKKNPMRSKLNCKDANSSRDLANELESLEEALETMTISLLHQLKKLKSENFKKLCNFGD